MENQQEETTELLHSVDYSNEKAALDTQIVTAKNFPRNIKRAIENAIAVVTMDKDTAATCTYSLPRGGKAITGPSVHLARILSQFWGNLRIESRVVSTDARQITSEAVCFDLETNLAVKSQVKRSIINKYGQRYNDDMQAMTGNAASAVAFRNAVFSVIPKAIVEKVYKSAMQVITGDVSDEQKLIAKRKQVVDALKDTYKVTEKEVLSVVGKVAIEHVTADDLVVLIGIGSSIKEGEISIETAFKKETESSSKDVLKETKEENIEVKNALKDTETKKSENKKQNAKQESDGKLPL